MKTHSATVPAAAADFLTGGGEMELLIREFDWSATPLGPLDSWPQNLRTCVRIMLTSRQPFWLGWGKELIKLYNDPYKAILGGKHPRALGRPASIVWKDIWKDIDPLLRQVMELDKGTYAESQLLIMERNGYPEETYYTFSYTPIPGEDGKTAGMICANTDDTERIISERRLRTLTELGQVLTEANSAEDVFATAQAVLQKNPQDFPFTCCYGLSGNQRARLTANPSAGRPLPLPAELDLGDPGPLAQALAKAAASGERQLLTGLDAEFGPLPRGAWPVSSGRALLIPIFQNSQDRASEFLLAGLNPYHLLNEKYQDFFSLIIDQVSGRLSRIHHEDQEKKRLQAMAELDQAKTTFFSNISHEFRTPLTLILAPMEDLLEDPTAGEQVKAQAAVVQRNALRLSKLVNSLLDFSRIEAGRMQAHFEPADISTITADLASSFRSAMERAGIALQVDCHQPADPVYIDTDMWEKIVLNLVSNAFKYTLEGSVHIELFQQDQQVLLTVTDTGVGIPENETGKIFERFHRIPDMQGRSQEGTGIGLSLVNELVKLHGGSIDVASQRGRGSRFTVKIPAGKAHLPAGMLFESPRQQIGSAALNPFASEAGRWSASEAALPKEAADNSDKPLVLLADDNADMRDYISRLLAPHARILAAKDGEEAYRAALQHKPDLLISDVMMPRLDGFGLLKRIRENQSIRSIPVLFLSARAGEEAKLEGLEAGADDYLVKPFSARELIARVDNNIRLSRTRLATETNLRQLILQAPVAMAVFRGSRHVVEIANEAAFEIWQKPMAEVIGRPLLEVFPELVDQGFVQILESVYGRGETFLGHERPISLLRNGELHKMYFNFSFKPLLDESARIVGVIDIAVDVTTQVLARKKIEADEKLFRTLTETIPQLIWMTDEKGNQEYVSGKWLDYTGVQPKDTSSWESILHEDDRKPIEEIWRKSLRGGGEYRIEVRLRSRFGEYRWHLGQGSPIYNEDHKIIRWIGSFMDIHDQKTFSERLERLVFHRTAELQRSNEELEQFAHVASHDLREPLRKIRTFASLLAETAGPEMPDKVRTYLDKIDSAAIRMNSMIQGILRYSSFQEAVEKEGPVNLNEVLRKIETDLEVLIGQKKATLQLEPLPLLIADSFRLYQLFYNLIANALKFSRPEEPPLIRISQRTIPHAEWAVLPKNIAHPYVSIQVEDNGIGFDPEFNEKIFKSFTRLNALDKYEGTGLGLALCRKIVTAYGGSIRAIGAEGKGACFILDLPLLAEGLAR